MNTKIEYLYRDACNYKKFSEEIVSGELTESEVKEIWECLIDGENFIPSQVGLPDDNRFTGTPDDHDFFELCAITSTRSAPTLDMTAAELFNNFRRAKNNWNFS